MNNSKKKSELKDILKKLIERDCIAQVNKMQTESIIEDLRF